MKFDIKAFANKLRSCEEIESVRISGKGVEYLNELLGFFLSSNSGMEIGEVNFDEFDSADADDFREIYNELWQRMGRVNKLFNFFDKVPPKSIKQASVFF